MEYAKISNPWFIIFFLSVNVLFASIVIRRQKKENHSSKPLSARELNAYLTDKPHKCSYCGYSFSLMPELKEGETCFIKAAKCPKCGNTDEVLKPYKG